MRDSLKLIAITCAGVFARVLALWVGRADFSGWFNHSYYYFVQTRSLLEEGRLAYPDMPALFHLYAWIAGALRSLGLTEDGAIVAASRLVMSIAPSLIPLPLYGIIRGLSGGRLLRGTQWVVVAMGGFLPLSISYLPDVQQKNALGLLLLMGLVYLSQRLLLAPGFGNISATAFVVVGIVLAHFGTAAAMLLYGVALSVAYAAVERSVVRSMRPILAVAAGAAVAAALVRAIDHQRFVRVLVYLRESVGDSLIARVWGEGAGQGALASLVVVALFYGALFVLFLGFRRHADDLSAGERVFWLSNLLFCALLVLPILDEHLMGRLSGFLPVPLLVLLAHLERFVLRRRWWRRGVVGVAALVLALLAVGELVSTRIHGANDQRVARDLERLEAAGLFGERDLVITRTGAEHICNWFFRVPAGVVTSLTLDDFDRYETVWVLNPHDGGQTADGSIDRVADSEGARYRVMLRNIPRPASIEPAFTTETIEVFALDGPPESWIFSSDGRWYGYGPEEPPS